MSAIHVGNTIKITGSNRHPRSDDLLVRHMGTDESVLDIGASDGSTSVDLIHKLTGFRSYFIADLFLSVTAREVGGMTVFFAPDGTAILLVGRRTLAWPSQSVVVRNLYWIVLRRAARQKGSATKVLLLNPAAQALIQVDPRVDYRVHDVFEPWNGPPPTVIKVANLLRRLYFPDHEILRALGVIRDSLPEGGLLLMVDNPRIAGIQERGALYRRVGQRFEPIATTEHEPEVHDLVVAMA